MRLEAKSYLQEFNKLPALLQIPLGSCGSLLLAKLGRVWFSSRATPGLAVDSSEVWGAIRTKEGR